MTYQVTFFHGDSEGGPETTRTYSTVAEMPPSVRPLAVDVEDLLVDPDHAPASWAFEVWSDEITGVRVEYKDA
jgi:hypothetical protein